MTFNFCPILIYCSKDLSIDFLTGFLFSIDWKENSYDAILAIVNQLTKIVYYQPVKITKDITDLAKIIIDVIVRHHSLLS